MPEGTLRVMPISDDESVMYVRIANDTESDAHLVRRDKHSVITSLMQMIATTKIVRLSNGDAYRITNAEFATA